MEITVSRKNGEVIFRGPMVRFNDGHSLIDLTIRNIHPAAIIWLQLDKVGDSTTWACMTTGWARFKALTVEVA